jgi:hypothetical protein
VTSDSWPSLSDLHPRVLSERDLHVPFRGARSAPNLHAASMPAPRTFHSRRRDSS